ncbi:MAG TPA: PadR family transcriptional regulator [Chthonomonadaceae bacterium]|nr:PadR family transcriptional regulator [Chthonomonadaceae bacterium]
MPEDRDLLRGNIPTLILAVVSEAPLHGLAIAREINQRSNNALQLKQGTLYPALHALERDGWITGAWELSDSERPRKIYTLTEAGKLELERRMEAWGKFAAAMDSVTRSRRREQPA